MQNKEDVCNAIILPSRIKRHKKDRKSSGPNVPRLSKNQQRKLRRLQEEKEQKDKRTEIFTTLQKHKLADNAYALLQASSTRGQRESMREKLGRAIQFERAGLKIPSGVPLFCERTFENGIPWDPDARKEGDSASQTTIDTASRHGLQVFLRKRKGVCSTDSSVENVHGGEYDVKVELSSTKRVWKEQEAGGEGRLVAEHLGPIQHDSAINGTSGAVEKVASILQKKKKRKAKRKSGKSCWHMDM